MPRHTDLSGRLLTHVERLCEDPADQDAATRVARDAEKHPHAFAALFKSRPDLAERLRAAGREDIFVFTR